MFLRLTFIACLVVVASAQTTDPDADALLSAIRRGAAADVERLLAKGANPNVRDGEGIPALMVAALFAGPRRALFAVGYAGWAPGQLEGELTRGGWLTASADEDVLFDTDHASKWRRATARRLVDL